MKKVTNECQQAYQSRSQENCDGVVCCLHTEGSIHEHANNKQRYMNSLSGLFIHPNVGFGIGVYNEE